MKLRILNILIVLIVINNHTLLISDSLYYETKNLFAIGLHGNGLYNHYSSNFSSFQGTLDCGLFEKGTGFAYSAGFSLDKNINTLINLGIDFDFSNRSGVFSTPSTLPIRDINMTGLNNIKIHNNLSTSLFYLDITPFIRFHVLEINKNLNFNLITGFRLGIPLINNFKQKDVIISPDYVNFISTGTKERLIAEGQIETINSLNYGIVFKIENMTELSKNFYFTQNLSFDYGINNITNDVEWKNISFGAGLGLRYNIDMRIEHRVIEEVIDTIIPEKQDTIISEIEYLSVEILEEKSDFHLQTGSELLATKPIINAVFFETNSSEIQNFYITNDMNMPTFFIGNPITARNYLFLRIKDIVQKNPNAKIHLVGSTSGIETESEGLELAKRRVEGVKKVFLNLGINENQISTIEVLLPKNPSNQDYPEGKMENQRVDIFIRNALLLEYVGIQKFSELVANSVVAVDFKNLKSKNLLLKTNVNDTLKISKPGNYNIPFVIRDLNDKFEFKVELENNNLSSSDSITIEYSELNSKQIDINYSNFKPILTFDFGSAELSLENRELLSQLVNQLNDNLTIIIKGSADALGTEAKNIQLSEQRATAVKDFINKITNNKFNIIIEKGFQKFDESTPEGRFLNRAISIEIRK